MNNYTHAKKVFDFYMTKLSEDDKVAAVYAQQYANLRILRLRTESLLNSLESYTIKASE
jgi:hypothetical protein